jgi:hypothetical protein
VSDGVSDGVMECVIKCVVVVFVVVGPNDVLSRRDIHTNGRVC